MLMQNLWVGERGRGGKQGVSGSRRELRIKKKLDKKSATPPHKKFVPQAEVKLMSSRG